MNNDTIIRRPDGKYEERLSEIWVAEFSENPGTGLWEVNIFRSDVPEWHSVDFESLEDARQAAYNFYDQA